MSEILRYVIVDDEGLEADYEYASFDEAKAEAIRLAHIPTTGSARGYAVIERTYTFDDSELIWTPDGSTVWP